MASVKNTTVYVALGAEHCDKKQGSNQYLLTKTDQTDDSAPNGTSRGHKKIIFLIILLIFLAIALCAIVVVLYMKTETLEQQWQNMEQQAEVRLEQSASRGMAIAEQVLANQQITNPEHKQEAVPGRTEEDKIDKAVSIHLTGSLPHLTLRSRSQKSEFQPLDIWEKKEVEGSVDQETVLTLINDSYIEIQDDGLYTIYGQLSWRGKRVIAVYQIQRFSEDSSTNETLAQCTTNFPDRYAVLESCYTSGTTQLHKGDRLALRVLRNNMTIDFDDGKSFFGVAQIQSNQEPEVAIH